MWSKDEVKRCGQTKWSNQAVKPSGQTKWSNQVVKLPGHGGGRFVEVDRGGEARDAVEPEDLKKGRIMVK